MSGASAPGRVGTDRVLATVLFTDIVGSTANAADLGDPPTSASICATDSTPSMNFGNCSNCVHWSYAVLTGTWTSIDSLIVSM